MVLDFVVPSPQGTSWGKLLLLALVAVTVLALYVHHWLWGAHLILMTTSRGITSLFHR